MEPNITQPDLDAKQPIGNGISTPVYKNDEQQNATVTTADVTNSTTELNITASEENRSAKFKNPQVKDDAGITYSDQ